MIHYNGLNADGKPFTFQSAVSPALLVKSDPTILELSSTRVYFLRIEMNKLDRRKYK